MARKAKTEDNVVEEKKEVELNDESSSTPEPVVEVDSPETKPNEDVVVQEEEPDPKQKDTKASESKEKAPEPKATVKDKDSVVNVDVPEGFVLVPLEPTTNQIYAGMRFSPASRAIYKVMVEQYAKDSEKDKK